MENSTMLPEYNSTLWSNVTAQNRTAGDGAGGGTWEGGGVSTEADMALTISYIIIGTVGIIGKSFTFFKKNYFRYQYACVYNSLASFT